MGGGGGGAGGEEAVVVEGEELHACVDWVGFSGVRRTRRRRGGAETRLLGGKGRGGRERGVEPT